MIYCGVVRVGGSLPSMASKKVAIRAFRVARGRAEYPNKLDYSNLQSLFPKTNALSIRPQGLFLPCGSRSRRQAIVSGRRASRIRRRSSRSWRLGTDRRLAAKGLNRI